MIAIFLAGWDRTLDTCYVKFYISESGVLIAGCPDCSKVDVSVTHSRKEGRVKLDWQKEMGCI